MNDQGKSELNELMGHIEENWRHLNTLFDDIAAAGDWSQQHGPD